MQLQALHPATAVVALADAGGLGAVAEHRDHRRHAALGEGVEQPFRLAEVAQQVERQQVQRARADRGTAPGVVEDVVDHRVRAIAHALALDPRAQRLDRPLVEVDAEIAGIEQARDLQRPAVVAA